MRKKNRIAEKYWDIGLFLILLIPLSVLLFVKCRYGYASRDEAFYLTIPYRLCQEDALLVNEWHLSQLISWVMQVPMRLYLQISGGGTEGIVLAFRQLYIAVHLCFAVLLFSLLRKYSRCGAVLAGLSFFVYAPFCISALSYNSLGIDCLTLAAALLCCGDSQWSGVFSGILYALAVLCCPYLAVLFVLYGAAVLTLRLIKRAPDGCPYLRRYGWFVLGVAGTAGIFVLTVFPRIPLSAWNGMLETLLSDPEHQVGLLQSLGEYFRLVVCRGYVLGMIVITAAACLVKKDWFRTLCTIAVLLATARSVYQSNPHINYLMSTVGFCGFYFYAVYRNPEARRFFYGFWVPGMLYTLCIHLGSNTGYLAISSAATVPMVASVMLIALSLKPLFHEKAAIGLRLGVAMSILLLVLVQGYWQVEERWNTIFWDHPIAEQTILLTQGPQKGLWVTPWRAEEYQGDMEATAHLEEGGTVLFFTYKTQYYLMGSWRNGAYSAWLGFLETVGDRLRVYYRRNPDKLPDQVLVDGENPEYADAFLESGAYVLRDVTPRGDQILKRLPSSE